ncbi:MAG TPA: GntG family PLP-dependent aldolase [Thermoanaerobaculia bacterium]|nr:GntG family PLP-dependent aldolase [Thermoanaerobaculia bacterium]
MTGPGAPIDLRSDTVTRPDAEMRAAMAAAPVGDDVFGEDPTVRRLEESAAALLGHGAALFMPSGTMGNQVALHLHARGRGAGALVLCEELSHVIHYEMGAMATLSGLLPKPLPGDRGRLDPAAVDAAIGPEVPYLSRPAAIVAENTHNMHGGTVTRPERSAELVAVARRHGLPIHLDGARLFNAAVALGVEPSALAAGYDSVMISLSKGLGCPVGSLLAGGADLVREARRVRKMLGGGMRQVGVLAAAGQVALDRGFAHLADDHANAAYLAAELAALPGVEIDPETVETNIVIFRVEERFAEGEGDGRANPAAAFAARATRAGVLCAAVARDRVRLVTHRDAPRPAVEEAARRLRAVASAT